MANLSDAISKEALPAMGECDVEGILEESQSRRNLKVNIWQMLPYSFYRVTIPRIQGEIVVSKIPLGGYYRKMLTLKWWL